MFDAQSALGGTWADERLYPGLKSNNLWGTYEFPDFPMDAETFGVNTDQHIPGAVIHSYLKAYAKNFDIAKLIHLRTKVQVAEHRDGGQGGWRLTVCCDGMERVVYAQHLIVATGLTSEPFLPHIDGQETFGGKIFHGKYFRQHKDTIKRGNTVTVLGAGKLSWDAVYAYATAGVKVNWVIRCKYNGLNSGVEDVDKSIATGHGPCWTSPSYVTPFRKWIEKLASEFGCDSLRSIPNSLQIYAS